MRSAHYLGLMGAPRRYRDLGEMSFLTPSVGTLNAFIASLAGWWLSRQRLTA